MFQWRIKEKEAIAKAKEIELKRRRNDIYKENQMHILKEEEKVFQKLTRVLFKRRN